jgi:ribosome-associated protein
MLIRIDPREVEITAIRAQGAGGQNINKVSNAAHLRFDICGSSLPDDVKERLLGCRDHRITAEGEVILKAQRYRSLERNREDALARLQALVDAVSQPQAPRVATRPTRASQRRRVEEKVSRGRIKEGRKKVGLD